MSLGSIGAYFDERAENWDAQAEPSGAKHLMIAQLAGIHEGSRVLDVGCGTGIMAHAYLELGAARIIGLDLSQSMIEHARANYADIPASRLSFECANVLDYVTEDPFDSIVIYNAFPHILDKDALVTALARLLKPDGRFLVAHGMGRQALNAHHHEVPADVTSDLLSAQESALPFERLFTIDMMADTPFTFFFGGSRK